MRLRIGESNNDYQDRVTTWHRWFAWYPVFIGTGDTRWLETVERRRSYCSAYSGDGPWYYRALNQEPK